MPVLSVVGGGTSIGHGAPTSSLFVHAAPTEPSPSTAITIQVFFKFRMSPKFEVEG